MPRKKKNKSKLIRDYIQSHSSADAKEIAEALKDKGVDYNYAYQILYKLNKPKTARRKVAAANGRASFEPLKLSEESRLIAVKKLADQVGGIETLKASVSLLEKLTS